MSYMRLSCARVAEPIGCRFGGRLIWDKGIVHIPRGKRHFWGCLYYLFPNYFGLLFLTVCLFYIGLWRGWLFSAVFWVKPLRRTLDRRRVHCCRSHRSLEQWGSKLPLQASNQVCIYLLSVTMWFWLLWWNESYCVCCVHWVWQIDYTGSLWCFVQVFLMSFCSFIICTLWYPVTCLIFTLWSRLAVDVSNLCWSVAISSGLLPSLVAHWY